MLSRNSDHKASFAKLVPPTWLDPNVPRLDCHGDDASPSYENVQKLAYEKWELAGKPTGEGSPYWFQAERELSNGTRLGLG